MDSSRFDAWTRRRFGLTTGGAALTGLLGLAGLHEADAKKDKKKKKKKCRKLGQSCDSNNKKKKCCNKKQLCAEVKHLTGTACCKQLGQGCSVNDDCCGDDICNNNDKCEIANGA